MLRIQKILFPVDFSERCTAAASQVADVARHFNAELTVLHVVQAGPLWYGKLAAAELEALVDPEEIRKERQLTLDSYLQENFQRLAKVEEVVEKGEPVQVITEYARKEGIDLIMMPTHGYGPFRRFLLGSVTAKVLHDAECPVWTDVHQEDSFARADCDSVICAVDLRPESVPSIQWAAGYAASFGAQLTLVHAIPAIAGPMRPEESRFRAYLIESARECIAGLQGSAGTQARVCIEGGKISEVIRNAAFHRVANVVVIGQGCMHETLGRLRSNAYTIVRESPCPVVRV
jgi:nucleotide-binding universal stress UspA family protein